MEQHRHHPDRGAAFHSVPLARGGGCPFLRLDNVLHNQYQNYLSLCARCAEVHLVGSTTSIQSPTVYLVALFKKGKATASVIKQLEGVAHAQEEFAVDADDQQHVLNGALCKIAGLQTRGIADAAALAGT